MRVATKILTSVLALTSLPAAASDFGTGFLVTMMGLFVVAIWPLVLPLFYLRGSNQKLKLYFALVLTAFGFVALLSVPFQLLAFINPPALFGGLISSENVPGAGALYLGQPLAIVASLWALPRVKRFLANRPVAPQQFIQAEPTSGRRLSARLRLYLHSVAALLRAGLIQALCVI